MNRKFLILTLIVFILAIATVNAQDNSTSDVVQSTDDDAIGGAYFYGNDGERKAVDTLDTHDVVKYYGDKSEKFTVEVYDDNYDPESGVKVSFGRELKSMAVKSTNSNGEVSFPVNYKVGKHQVMTYVKCKNSEGKSGYVIAKNTVTVKTTIPTKTVSKHINEKNKNFRVKFLNSKGKALAGKTIKLKVKGKTYNLKTNSNGIASIQVNYKKVGTYKMVAINPSTGEKKNIKVKIQKRYKVRTVTTKIHNSKKVGYFSDKCTKLIKGDAVICISEHSKHSQFSRGVTVEHWYVGDGKSGEDMDAHHTKLIKAKLYYKNSKGKVITKTKKARDWGGVPTFSFVKGYTPYKMKIWYREK